MVVFPNGFLSYLCGPVSAQQNAVGLLNMSWLNYHMVALQPDITMWRAQGGNVLYYSLYGDKIFPYLMCITHAHEAPLGDQLTDLAYTEKRAMNSLQTSVEWHMVMSSLCFMLCKVSVKRNIFYQRGC
jgi:hypothetical protein